MDGEMRWNRAGVNHVDVERRFACSWEHFTALHAFLRTRWLVFNFLSVLASFLIDGTPCLGCFASCYPRRLFGSPVRQLTPPSHAFRIRPPEAVHQDPILRLVRYPRTRRPCQVSRGKEEPGTAGQAEVQGELRDFVAD